MRYKTIVNDVDGCFSTHVHSDGISFTEETHRDIATYKSFTEDHPGLQFTLCTGRAMHQVQGILAGVPRITWVVHENGSLVSNAKNGTQVNLCTDHPSTPILNDILTFSRSFADEQRIPKKVNVVTIDVGDEPNPAYYNQFLSSMPSELKAQAETIGISFQWDPTAINVSPPITKGDGLKELAKQCGASDPQAFLSNAAYIGDSTSDIEGMRMCGFAAAPNNCNNAVRSYLEKERIPNGTGYISPFTFSKGNLDCLQHITKVN